MSVPNLKRITPFVQKLKRVPKFRNLVTTQATPTSGSFYNPYAGRVGPRSISAPNLKRMALFVHELLGVPKFRNLVTWPMPRPLGDVLWSTRSRGPSSISVPNLKPIAQYVQQLLSGS